MGASALLKLDKLTKVEFVDWLVDWLAECNVTPLA